MRYRQLRTGDVSNVIVLKYRKKSHMINLNIIVYNHFFKTSGRLFLLY